MIEVEQESRTMALMKSTVTIAIYEVAVLVSGFVVPKIMLQFYGSATNGLVSSITQLLNYVILIEAGLTASLIYTLYKPLAKKDYQAINRIYSAGWKYYNRVGCYCYGVVIVAAIAYPFIIGDVPGVNRFEVAGLILTMGLASALNFWVMGKYNIIITADKKTYIYNVVRIVYTVIFMTIIALAAVCQISILWARIVGLLGTGVQALIVVLYVKKHYPLLDHHENPDKSALKLRGDAFAQEIASTVQLGAPQVILTFVSRDMLIVSVYSIFNIVIGGIISLISLFGTGSTAVFGELIASDDKPALRKAFSSLETMILMVATVLFSVSFVMIMPFIRVYTAGITDIAYDLPVVGFLAVLNCLVFTIQAPEKTLVRAAGLYRETRYRAIIQTLLCVVVGTVLCIWFDIYGVLIGLLVSNLYRCVDLLLFAHKYITVMSFIQTLQKWMLVLAVCVVFIIADHFMVYSVDSYLDWLFTAVIWTIAAVTITVVLFILFFKEEVVDIKNRVVSLVRK